MSTNKIAIVGKGTAGAISAMHFSASGDSLAAEPSGRPFLINLPAHREALL